MEIRNTFSYNLPTRIVYSLIILLREHLIYETLWKRNFIFGQTSRILNVDFTFTFLYLISKVGDDNDRNADSH